MKIAFVQNFASHYTVGTFELLAREFDVDFFFFSAGGERYWLPQHGVSAGNFRHEYLRGFDVAGTRITPQLPLKLLSGRYDVFISGIDGRFAMPVTYAAARLTRKPFILWTGVWNRIESRFHRLLFPLTRHIYGHSDAVVAYGEHVRRYLVSEGVNFDRIFIAPHSVDNFSCGRAVSDAEILHLYREMGIPSGAPIVLFIGRLEEVKGLEYLIPAFARAKVPGAHLILAGEGSHEQGLRRLADEHGVGNITHFPGYVSPDRTAEFYAAAAVFVLPSVTTQTSKELWGLVVNEAFNQGTPAITTNAVGAAAGGLVQDGVNGYIVPERESAALAIRIRTALLDPSVRNQLSAGARRTIATWNQAGMVAGFRAAVESVARRDSRSSVVRVAARDCPTGVRR